MSNRLLVSLPASPERNRRVRSGLAQRLPTKLGWQVVELRSAAAVIPTAGTLAHNHLLNLKVDRMVQTQIGYSAVDGTYLDSTVGCFSFNVENFLTS